MCGSEGKGKGGRRAVGGGWQAGRGVGIVEGGREGRERGMLRCSEHASQRRKTSDWFDQAPSPHPRVHTGHSAAPAPRASSNSRTTSRSQPTSTAANRRGLCRLPVARVPLHLQQRLLHRPPDLANREQLLVGASLHRCHNALHGCSSVPMHTDVASHHPQYYAWQRLELHERFRCIGQAEREASAATSRSLTRIRALLARSGPSCRLLEHALLDARCSLCDM